MRHLTNAVFLSSNRKARREAQLRRLSSMRAAKERKRLARVPQEPEPKRARWYPIEFAVRDKRTGEVAWHDLVSVRHAETALRLLLQAETKP